ncbi:hypothetical protein QQF64_035044 [Cirrhinus molitorella]|uniref:Uncharacterized protein n=1 Tax=Cirrhinus molitorella TaxID=172907 RepID=A0ABR3NFC7_9TELE
MPAMRGLCLGLKPPPLGSGWPDHHCRGFAGRTWDDRTTRSFFPAGYTVPMNRPRLSHVPPARHTSRRPSAAVLQPASLTGHNNTVGLFVCFLDPCDLQAKHQVLAKITKQLMLSPGSLPSLPSSLDP